MKIFIEKHQFMHLLNLNYFFLRLLTVYLAAKNIRTELAGGISRVTKLIEDYSGEYQNSKIYSSLIIHNFCLH